MSLKINTKAKIWLSFSAFAFNAIVSFFSARITFDTHKVLGFLLYMSACVSLVFSLISLIKSKEESLQIETNTKDIEDIKDNALSVSVEETTAVFSNPYDKKEGIV